MGVERLLVKNGKMMIYFVGEQASPFYQSSVFSNLLKFVQQQQLPCRFNEKNEKLSLVFTEITNIEKFSRYIHTLHKHITEA